MYQVVESFIELNVGVLVYLGLFFLADQVLTNRKAYSVDERMRFQIDMTTTAAYLFTLLYWIWNLTDVPYKRLHGFHLSLHILRLVFTHRKKDFYSLVRFGFLLVYHLFDNYETTNVLVLMTVRELFRCVDVVNVLHRQFQWKGLARNLRLRQAAVVLWAVVVSFLLTTLLWQRSFHWTLVPFLCLFPRDVVCELQALQVIKEHYK